MNRGDFQTKISLEYFGLKWNDIYFTLYNCIQSLAIFSDIYIYYTIITVYNS